MPLWGLPPGLTVFGWLTGGADGAAGAAVGAAVILLFLTVPLEVSQSRRLYGGVRVADGRLHVGRRSVPVAALDLSSMTSEASAEAFAVLGKGRLMSNPIWLRDLAGAIDGLQVVRAERVRQAGSSDAVDTLLKA